MRLVHNLIVACCALYLWNTFSVVILGHGINCKSNCKVKFDMSCKSDTQSRKAAVFFFLTDMWGAEEKKTSIFMTSLTWEVLSCFFFSKMMIHTTSKSNTKVVFPEFVSSLSNKMVKPDYKAMAKMSRVQRCQTAPDSSHFTFHFFISIRSNKSLRLKIFFPRVTCSHGNKDQVITIKQIQQSYTISTYHTL